MTSKSKVAAALSLILVSFGCEASVVSQSSRAPALVELVQSAPVETTLADPGLPFAKDVWVAMIRGARSTIDIGQMYVQNQNPSDLEPVLRELEAAGARGVKIRFIVSAQMAKTDPPTMDRLRKIPGAELRIYDLGNLTGGIIHAKYWIIDGHESFIGSQNFDWKALTHIHEMGIHVIDDAQSAKLESIFEMDWQTAGKNTLPSKPNAPQPCNNGALELDFVASPPVLNPPGVCDSISVLLSLIQQASDHLWIQVMDYSTSGKKEGEAGPSSSSWREIDQALRAAAKRGVHIRLMVSNWATGKPTIDQLKDLSKTPGIELRIVTIPEWSGGHIPYARLVHSKFMIVDSSTLWMGTSNWSKGYFYSTRGVEMVVRKPDLNAQGARVFDRIWSSSYAEPIDVNKDYPPPIKD